MTTEGLDPTVDHTEPAPAGAADQHQPVGPSANGAAAGSQIGTVGSPSTTGEVTVDINAEASDTTLLGDMVCLTHPIANGRHLLALGTVSDIETRNRWHEDPNMRGVLKVHGSLPHLSAVGDTRTAAVVIQAVYNTDAEAPPFGGFPRESGGMLGMSPTTGTPVRRVSDALVQSLTARHAGDVVYLGYVYRTKVRLPLFIRDFAGEETDGAFHTGIFGRNGSGKTALAVYFLAAQLRHDSLGALVFDPQGQWATQANFPFNLHDWARGLGRQVQVLSIAQDIQLPKDAGLCLELLEGSTFFRQLTLKATENREAAAVELARYLGGMDDWERRPSDEVLRRLLSQLGADEPALTRIYNSKSPRDRLTGQLQLMLTDAGQFRLLADIFRPIHNLFAARNLHGQPRTPLESLLTGALSQSRTKKPLVIIDLASSSGSTWLDSTETKARIIRKITSKLRLQAEFLYRQTKKPINCLVLFDEAHRFAAAHPEGEQAGLLAARLVEYVRETRKYGLGWTFVTQEISALASGIYNQLRIRAFGYGLTTGSDLVRLTDEVGRGTALELYKSFADPRALSEKVYPFMLTGPVSPLSFTSAPVFLQVFTDHDSFLEANAAVLPSMQATMDLGL